MDLTHILRSRIEALPPGDYSVGLQSVLLHIEVAVRHLERGQNEVDDTAFTDAVYRTNQAFEGSLKEAYRVLAEKDVRNVRPYDIELYLQNQAVLRPRVVDEFANYRRQWRNPSTHDYSLDFDEDEALLAIVSVCAFAIVLIDQVAETLSFRAAQIAAKAYPPARQGGPLLERVSGLLGAFPASTLTASAQRSGWREVELVGALAGYLSSVLDERVVTDAQIGDDSRVRADLVVTGEDDEVLVETKRGPATKKRVAQALQQVASLMDAGRLKSAVLYFHPDDSGSEIVAEEAAVRGVPGRVILLHSVDQTPD